jgi:SAM-dependent methyltransferase
MNGLTDSKTEKVAGIIKQVYPEKIQSLFVVGCGDGIEAAILATELGAMVVGIDVAESFDPRASAIADLRVGDAMAVDCPDETFDFVFSYHALEHIADPMQALREMHRVLKSSGGFWIGTPNRTRLIGYIGAKEGTLRDKIRWNLADYRARLAGKFRNEFGAHAGFTSPELHAMLASVFEGVRDVSDTYFNTLYSRFSPAMRIIAVRPLARVMYPSVYFTGKK